MLLMEKQPKKKATKTKKWLNNLSHLSSISITKIVTYNRWLKMILLKLVMH